MDLSKANLAVITEVIRQAESYLKDQLIIATSADQRASTLASTFCVAGTAIIAGLITLTGADLELRIALPVVLGGTVAGSMFLWAALICVKTSLPASFTLAGNEPANWDLAINDGETLQSMLVDQAHNYQEQIEENDRVIQRNATLFKRGATWGVFAPFSGLTVWALSMFVFWL